MTQQSEIIPLNSITAQQVTAILMASSKIKDLLRKKSDWRTQAVFDLAIAIEDSLMVQPGKQ